MKTILVTGGAGYIGSHTVVELLKNPDYDVIIIDNFSNSKLEILNRIYRISKRPIKVYCRDCKDNINDILSENKIDSVIHFAAYKSVGDSIKNPISYYDNNINSLLNILNSCKAFGIKNIVFSSSCSLYGNLKELPAKEDSELSDPESPYAYTKLVSERILKDFSNVNPDIKIASLRYFNPVGAHESFLIGESPVNNPNNIMPLLCDSALTGSEFIIFGDNYNTIDGTCIRDYVHVSDIADAHILLLEHLFVTDKSYDVFNLGSERGISVLELIKAFNDFNWVKVNYKIGERREGDIAEIYADSTKIKSIGWKPKRNINQIVHSSFEWHKKRI